MGKAKTSAAEPAEPAKIGRPPSYKAAFAEQAQKLCRLGATDLELADFFEVNVRTIYRWKHTHEAFCQAVTCGKDAADDRVERALYNRAVGYSHPAVKIFMPAGAVAPVYAPYEEHVPPDAGAAFNWLKNRKPDEWRDVKAQEISGPNGSPLQVHQLTDKVSALPAEKRAAMRAALKAAMGDAES